MPGQGPPERTGVSSKGVAELAAPPTPLGSRVAGDLERNLRRVAGVGERLLRALQAQRESLCRLDAEGLSRAVAEAETAAGAIAQLRMERRRLLGGPAATDGVEGGDDRWETLLSGVAPDMRRRLVALRRRLDELARRIRRTNEVNRRIVERARAHFSGLLESILAGGGATYAPGKGAVTVTPGAASGLVDRVA